MVSFSSRRCMLAGLLALSLLGLGSHEAQAQQPVRPKVVVQMSEADPAKWNLALNNVRNLQTDLGTANIDIELVAYGPGIGMLKADSVVATRIDEALGASVKVPA